MPDDSSASYLVTGATGFVGRALCRRLSGRGRVRALSRAAANGDWYEHFAADIAADLPLDDAVQEIDSVFHLRASVAL